MSDTREEPANGQLKEKKLCPVFGDLGAVLVEWGSPEHLSMQHSRLRGDTRRGLGRGRKSEPLMPHKEQGTSETSE